MNVNFPPPTITLSATDLCDAVQDYLIKKSQIQGTGTLADYWLGNLVKTELRSETTAGSARERLTGSLTFELLKT